MGYYAVFDNSMSNSIGTTIPGKQEVPKIGSGGARPLGCVTWQS